jgi:hypothetical protein
VTKAYPPLAQFAGDLLIKNMDWPGAQEIAERLKKTLPPGLADDPKNKQPLPPEAQAQMQQLQQMVEQLTGKLNESQDIIQQKRVELESKERIEMAKIEADIQINLAKLGSQEALAMLNHQVAEISERMKMLNFHAPIQDVTQDQSMAHPEMSPEEMAPQDSAGVPMDGFADEQGFDPTGGESPGQPLEGFPTNDNPDLY